MNNCEKLKTLGYKLIPHTDIWQKISPHHHPRTLCIRDSIIICEKWVGRKDRYRPWKTKWRAVTEYFNTLEGALNFLEEDYR